MACFSTSRKFRVLGGLVAGLTATWLVPTPAQAAVTADQFIIRYFTTDDEGNPDTELFADRDLQNYVNQARCECSEEIVASIQIRQLDSSSRSTPVSVFVGRQCATAFGNTAAGFDPCVKLREATASSFARETPVRVNFPPIWLGSGVANINDNDISTAQPANDCNTNEQGTGSGIWICVDDNGTGGCQQDEFIVNGTIPGRTSMGTGSTNDTMGDPTGTGAGGNLSLWYDFRPPDVGTIRDFRISEGDGSVQIAWEQDAADDIAGFMVLCADEAGNPLPNKGLTPAQAEQRTYGELYYTADNVCPGEAPDPQPGEDGGSTGGDAGVGTGTGGDAGVGTGTGGDAGVGTDTGGQIGTGGDTGASGPSGPATNDPANAGLLTLDWGYICTTTRLPNTSTSARIDGLTNGEQHRFLVVAYDWAGNPQPVSDVLEATPRETHDFWERCEANGDLCGDGGFCSVTTRGHHGAPLLLLLLACGTLRRRRTAR